MMLSRVDMADSVSSWCCGLAPGWRSVDLIGLDVGQLALRGQAQRAERDGHERQDGNPGTYDADAHDRTLSCHRATTWSAFIDWKRALGPLKSYLLNGNDWQKDHGEKAKTLFRQG
jgi:hypothetical protein